MLIKVTAIVCMADILSKARCEIRNKCEFSLTILYMYIFEKKNEWTSLAGDKPTSPCC